VDIITLLLFVIREDYIVGEEEIWDRRMKRYKRHLEK
jgi:hypothetical protein